MRSNQYNNVFTIYIKSDDSTSVNATFNRHTFNIGDLLAQTASNSSNYNDRAFCNVKVRYFDIKDTVANFTAANVSTILIEINNGCPNNIQTVDGDSAMNSSIIATVPTGSTANVYSNSEFDNSPVIMNNMFNGIININLLDQDGGDITLTAAKKFYLVLEVEFMDKPENTNINNINSTEPKMWIN